MTSLASQLSSRRLARAEARQSNSDLKTIVCNLMDKDERFAQHIRAILEEYQRTAAAKHGATPPAMEASATKAAKEAAAVETEAAEQVAPATDGATAAPAMEASALKVKEEAAAVEVNDTDAALQGELARVKALPEEERAAVGKKYTDPEELWLALGAGGGDATHILRASWVKKQRGGRLPKRGDLLPPEATITVAELRQIAMASSCSYGALPVIALSHFWRTKEHPDPDGETLRLVISALEQHWSEFEGRGVTDLGIIIDWCALWQAPRETPEKVEAFKAGLKGINQWYAHAGTTVWLVTAGSDCVNGLTYWDKGWTSFEFALAMLIKPANTSSMKDWPQVVDLGKESKAQIEFTRPPLSEPLAFFGGHAYGAKTYTNGADRDAIVAPKFRETMFEVMGGVKELNFGTLKWGDSDVQALAVVLPLCGQLTKLQVHQNSFGDAGMVALAGAMGAMAGLTELRLGFNQIGDAGMQAFSTALANGAPVAQAFARAVTPVSPI